MGTGTSRPKLKMINDPVYGFITIPTELAFRVIEHPYFQRLRRIRQLGMTHLVYPGAMHTRFQHSLGAMHLMNEAIDALREKGHEITGHEKEAATLAALMHDIGHGPFSHALEHSIVEGTNHERISLLFMDSLNQQFGGTLDTVISIFRNAYPKRFLHQLVAGQLDVDRLDYLKRDSFFCGVAEGIVNNDRIIKTMNIIGDNIGIDAKGLYSVEKYIIARRLMYWQVYLHKTVLSAEALLTRILRRAKYVAGAGGKLFAPPSLLFFLENKITAEAFASRPDTLHHFSRIDDFDVIASIKTWMDHEDTILSTLSQWLINRELFRVEIQSAPFEKSYVLGIQSALLRKLKISEEDIGYFLFSDTTSNYSYDLSDNRIEVLLKNGQTIGLPEASGLFNLTLLTSPDTRHVLGYPKFARDVQN